MIDDAPILDNLSTRYELLVASISDYAIYMLDEQGLVCSWDAGAVRLTGYAEDEVLGTPFGRLHTSEERAAMAPRRALATARDEGRFECEGWRVRKDGTRFWASVVIDPIVGPAAQHLGFAIVMRDMTERRQAQEALRASEQQFRLLVQGVVDYAIYMLSPDGCISNWNLGAERIKGYAREEVVGSHFRRFFTDEDRRAGVPEQALATAAREGRFESEGWRVRKDGSRFWAHAVIDAIHDEQGTLVGFAKITHDNTEKRRAAESLEQTRAALFQAQKMEAIGQLTGGVAHDFNNLLAVVSNGVDILRARAPAGVTPVLDSMRRAVERGAALTQQLLSFARQQPLAPSVQQLDKLVIGFEGVLRRAAGPLVRFALRLDPGLRPASIDAARFEAAVLNLVVNARDAMPDGGALELRMQNVHLAQGEVGTLPAGEYVRLTVADDGLGMSGEVSRRAFEPFFTTKEVGKGSGLGLSQVYGFIVQSGGGVTLETAPGRGTAVHLFLPALSADLLPPPSDEQAPREERVLIVEDDPLVLESTRELFQSMGYVTLSASTALEALNTLQYDSGISVLFSDVMMPDGMSGLELAREVRQRYPAIKIILASGYPQPALKGQGLAQFAFIGKPYRLADLARQLRMA